MAVVIGTRSGWKQETGSWGEKTVRKGTSTLGLGGTERPSSCSSWPGAVRPLTSEFVALLRAEVAGTAVEMLHLLLDLPSLTAALELQLRWRPSPLGARLPCLLQSRCHGVARRLKSLPDWGTPRGRGGAGHVPAPPRRLCLQVVAGCV